MANYKSFMLDLGQDVDTEPISAECCVHFRPKEDWNGKDYGFDWMRLGNKTVPFGDDKPYTEIVGKQYVKGTGYKNLEKDLNECNGDFKCDKALYEKLEDDYSKSLVAWKNDPNDPTKMFYYHPSWLSLYPPMPSPGPNGEAQLRLLLDVGKVPDQLVFDDNEYYEITPKFIYSDLKEQNTPYFWENGKKTVTVKCKQPTSFDQTIKVRALKRNSITGKYEEHLAGKLRIWANSGGKQKALKILFVHVITPAATMLNAIVVTVKGSAYTAVGPSGRGLETGKIVHPGPKVTPPLKPAAPANNGPTGTSRNQREIIDRYLRQALISAEVSVEKLDISDDINFKLGGHYRHPKGILGSYAPVYNKNGGLVKNPQAPTNFKELEDHLYEKLQEKLKDEYRSPDLYADYKRVFFLGERGGIITGATGNILAPERGYSPADHNNIVTFQNYADATVVHELLHSLGLRHSFTNFEADADGNAKFTYKALSTENIMDYSSARYSLWHWQWKIANGNVK